MSLDRTPNAGNYFRLSALLLMAVFALMAVAIVRYRIISNGEDIVRGRSAGSDKEQREEIQIIVSVKRWEPVIRPPEVLIHGLDGPCPMPVWLVECSVREVLKGEYLFRDFNFITHSPSESGVTHLHARYLLTLQKFSHAYGIVLPPGADEQSMCFRFVENPYELLKCTEIAGPDGK